MVSQSVSQSVYVYSQPWVKFIPDLRVETAALSKRQQARESQKNEVKKKENIPKKLRGRPSANIVGLLDMFEVEFER